MNYRYSNKRIGKRAGNGRFARVTARDVIGTDFNDREQVCRDCDYHWTPLVVSGKCLRCHGTSTHAAPPPPEIQAKIDRYNEIQQQNPYGINPLDRDTLAEVQRLYGAVRRWL